MPARKPLAVGPEPKSVGIWVRDSTDLPGQADSPERHEKRARYYAEAKGCYVRRMYRLEVVCPLALWSHSSAVLAATSETQGTGCVGGGTRSRTDFLSHFLS